MFLLLVEVPADSNVVAAQRAIGLSHRRPVWWRRQPCRRWRLAGDRYAAPDGEHGHQWCGDPPPGRDCEWHRAVQDQQPPESGSPRAFVKVAVWW